MTTAVERPLYGAMMIVAGLGLIGVIDNFVWIIAEHVGLWQFHFTRSALAAPLIILICTIFGIEWRPKRLGPALIRTAFIAGSMLLYFGSLPAAPIAQVAAGILTSPIWVLAITALFLSGSLGPRRVIAVAVGFAGVCLVLKPWQSDFTFWSLIPIAAGALYAGASITTRRLCADEPPIALVLLFFFALGIAGAVGMAALTIWPAPTLAEEAPFFFTAPTWPIASEGWFWMGVQAVGSIFCILLVTRGYQSADTSYVALFEYS
ncbi:MAG: DMT family transporter, partial [Pseudomonadota bacterium]